MYNTNNTVIIILRYVLDYGQHLSYNSNGRNINKAAFTFESYFIIKN